MPALHMPEGEYVALDEPLYGYDHAEAAYRPTSTIRWWEGWFRVPPNANPSGLVGMNRIVWLTETTKVKVVVDRVIATMTDRGDFQVRAYWKSDGAPVDVVPSGEES